MRWLILIGDDKFNLDTIKLVEHEGCIDCYDVTGMERRYCVDFGKDHIFYDYIEDIDDFEEDLGKVPFINPHFITMTYTSEECAKKILQQGNFPNDIYIDNDHGIILPIKDFVRLGMPMDLG